ncbi:MAG TPA: DinB family protein [Jatrophihabitantaceae bacterium]|nr:DinB family protein [Jatrophihabitantaceae bacterium]
MTETQREPVPRVDTGELETALAFLRFARHCVVKKTDGLSDEQLRRVLVPSGTSLLGLVQHLTTGERWWFGHHFAEITPGADPADDDESGFDFSMQVPHSVPASAVLDAYGRAIEDSDALITRLGDVEARTTRAVDGQFKTLRWVLAHATSEVARHAGHADILRELLDGTTGR